ncbi:MAG: amidohydrolase family protein [Gammaproteobacteria bacterium]|nr:amidohydrolase family protein [Gammaproteobacteria bacterium]MDE0273914.1 amidohydrolase family protein [Gammaproteobacteria bacterium]
MLITRAEIHGADVADLRIEQGKVTAIGRLARRSGEEVLDLQGGAALPGLNDHHIHFMAYAASLDSVACGPPKVRTPEQLIEALGCARPNKDGWIRGIGYHQSVAGDVDRHWLDRHLPDTPVRVQHRSGRLWIVNNAGLERLAGISGNGALPFHDEGRFHDQDEALGRLWGRTSPTAGVASARLAAYGVTGLTDLTPHNDNTTAARFEELRSSGTLMQAVRVGGMLRMSHRLTGPTKIHLHDSDLPDFDDLCDLVRASHARRREVAVHCVTEAELVFALAAFREAGACPGDRIEHASITPPALLSQLRELGLLVVTQPHFIAERGDAYRRELPCAEHNWLYRCRGFLDGGIPLAAGSDAPFGHADPWRAMHAAVTRQTASGHTLGPWERLTPEEAVSLFMGALDEPRQPRRIAVGGVADLCLLDRPWREARVRLDSACVRATVQNGNIIYNSVDGPERESSSAIASISPQASACSASIASPRIAM